MRPPGSSKAFGPRQRVAIETLLFSLKTRFPELFKRLFSDHVFKMCLPKHISGKHIKLRRSTTTLLLAYL